MSAPFAIAIATVAAVPASLRSTVALAIAKGADIVRVHDVAPMRDVVRMADAVVRGWTKP